MRYSAEHRAQTLTQVKQQAARKLRADGAVSLARALKQPKVSAETLDRSRIAILHRLGLEGLA